MAEADAAALLAASALRGEPAADTRSRRVRALVAAHQDFIWRSLRRLGVPPGHVDDATQEVFCVAVRRLGDIDRAKERSFLFGVAMRVASDARRAHARSREHADPAAIEAAVATAKSPEGALEEQQDRALLDEALDALDDDSRVVFVLFEIEGLTSPEIAALLGLALGTVASRLRRAREQFHVAAARLRSRIEQGGAR